MVNEVERVRTAGYVSHASHNTAGASVVAQCTYVPSCVNHCFLWHGRQATAAQSMQVPIRVRVDRKPGSDATPRRASLLVTRLWWSVRCAGVLLPGNGAGSVTERRPRSFWFHLSPETWTRYRFSLESAVYRPHLLIGATSLAWISNCSMWYRTEHRRTTRATGARSTVSGQLLLLVEPPGMSRSGLMM
jgi:hypothetical protein